MLETDRHNKIMEMLRTKHGCTVRDMALAMDVSDATIRRDLRYLDYMGIVRRVHGGAVLLKDETSVLPRSVRSAQQQNAKQIIGQKAAQLVSDGMVIFMDASTTAHAMCEYLKPRKNITIITTAIRTAEILCEMQFKTYCTGGELSYHSLSYIGAYAEKMLREFNASAAFFSVAGLTLDGKMSERQPEDCMIIRAMVEQSKKRYLLCDSTKLGCLYCYHVDTIDCLDGIVSEASLPSELQVLSKARFTIAE